MKVTLFDKDITPYCTYCEHFTQGGENRVAICAKHGTLEEFEPCKSFLYAPLKRTPTAMAPLPTYSKEDFSF